MRRFALFFIASFLLVIPAYAQDGYPLPSDLAPITPDNAAQLTELASIGGTLPGGLAWSPDGVYLAVGTSENVQVFDTENLDQTPIVIPGDGKLYFDGEKLVSDEQFWDIKTGEWMGDLRSVLPPPPDDSLKRSPSGNIIVFRGEEKNSLRLWRSEGNTTLTLDPQYIYVDMVFSPDEDYAALILQNTEADGYGYPVIQLWNTKSGRFIADLPQMLDIMDTVAFHADGAILVTATTTNAPYGISEDVKLWNGHTGEPIKLPREAHLPVRFSPDGRLLAYLTWEGISLWTDHELGVLKFDPYYEAYSEIDSFPLLFSQDSRTLTTLTGNQILLWEVSGSKVPAEPAQTLEAEANIYNLLYNPDESLLVSTESGGIAEIWNMKTGQRQARLQASAFIYDAKFSPDGSLLRVTEFGGSFLVWDVVTGEKRLTLPQSAVFNGDWSKAAYWDGSTVQVADAARRMTQSLYQIPAYLGGVSSFNANSGQALFVGDDVQGYDLKTGENFFQQPIEENLPLTQFNSRGSHFFTAVNPTIYGRGYSTGVDIWDTSDLSSPVTNIQIPDGGGRLLLSPDGKLLSQLNTACGDGGGGNLQVWDAQTGKAIFGLRPGGECGPYAHAFTPDGKYLVVAWDMSVAIMDVNAAVTQPPEHTNQLAGSSKDTVLFYRSFIDQLTLSSDGTMLAVSLTGFVPEFGSEPPASWLDIVSLADVLNPGNAIEMPTENTIRINDAKQAQFSPDNHYILTENGLYDARIGDLLASISVPTAAFSPDSKILAIKGENVFALFAVAALAQGKVTPLATFAAPSVQEVAFNSAGNSLYIRRVGNVQVWGIPPAS